jgi:hypothetical protein
METLSQKKKKKKKQRAEGLAQMVKSFTLHM